MQNWQIISLLTLKAKKKAARGKSPYRLTGFQLCRNILSQQWCDNERDNAHQLDEDVHCGTGSILERVTNGIAYNGGLVGVPPFFLACQFTLFDEFFGIIPDSAGICHKERHQNAGHCCAGQSAAQSFLAEGKTDDRW